MIDSVSISCRVVLRLFLFLFLSLFSLGCIFLSFVFSLSLGLFSLGGIVFAGIVEMDCFSI